jgi:hypothetical protein
MKHGCGALPGASSSLQFATQLLFQSCGMVVDGQLMQLHAG